MSQLIALDGGLLLLIQEHLRADWMDGFWKGMTSLGDGGMFWILLSLILLFFRPTRKAGAAALLSVALCFVCSNLILKHLVARARPYELFTALRPLIPLPTDSSFPSGHTTASFAAALSYLRMKPGMWTALAVLLAALIALSRLYVGVHYPTDVVGGFLVAFIGSWLVCRWLKGRKTGIIEEKTPSE